MHCTMVSQSHSPSGHDTRVVRRPSWWSPVGGAPALAPHMGLRGWHRGHDTRGDADHDCHHPPSGGHRLWRPRPHGAAQRDRDIQCRCHGHERQRDVDFFGRVRRERERHRARHCGHARLGVHHGRVQWRDVGGDSDRRRAGGGNDHGRLHEHHVRHAGHGDAYAAVLRGRERLDQQCAPGADVRVEQQRAQRRLGGCGQRPGLVGDHRGHCDDHGSDRCDQRDSCHGGAPLPSHVHDLAHEREHRDERRHAAVHRHVAGQRRDQRADYVAVARASDRDGESGNGHEHDGRGGRERIYLHRADVRRARRLGSACGVESGLCGDGGSERGKFLLQERPQRDGEPGR